MLQGVPGFRASNVEGLLMYFQIVLVCSMKGYLEVGIFPCTWSLLFLVGDATALGGTVEEAKVNN